MTQKHSLMTMSVLAAGTITAHTFVGTDNKTAAAGADAIGVAVFDAGTGDMLAVDVLGSTIVRAEAAIAAGARVQVGAAGGAVTATTGVPVGRAVEAVAAGALFEVLLFQGASAPASGG